MDQSGSAVASAGDANGDGFDDVLVWAQSGGRLYDQGLGYLRSARADRPIPAGRATYSKTVEFSKMP